MPADIKLILPKMASENTIFYEKLAEAVPNYPMPLGQIQAQMISRLQIKKPFVLVLASEHSQVLEVNAAVIRKL